MYLSITSQPIVAVNKKTSTRQVAHILRTLLSADELKAVMLALCDSEHDSRISDAQVIVTESLLDHLEAGV